MSKSLNCLLVVLFVTVAGTSVFADSPESLLSQGTLMRSQMNIQPQDLAGPGPDHQSKLQTSPFNPVITCDFPGVRPPQVGVKPGPWGGTRPGTPGVNPRLRCGSGPRTSDDYVGLSLDAAIEQAKFYKTPFRILRNGDQNFPATADYLPGRLNFYVDDGIVTRCTRG